jgi:serine/threonine-protein kinase RsbW
MIAAEMSSSQVIELSLPGLLQFCDVARRVVMESCNLLGARRLRAPSVHNSPSMPSERYEFHDRFTIEFVSAFSEIYNNIALHAYGDNATGSIALTITIGDDTLLVDIRDTGKVFDINAVPLPDELPMGGMGIFLARSMLDELEYQSGPPNRWRLLKHMSAADGLFTTEDATLDD